MLVHWYARSELPKSRIWNTILDRLLHVTHIQNSTENYEYRCLGVIFRLSPSIFDYSSSNTYRIPCSTIKRHSSRESRCLTSITRNIWAPLDWSGSKKETFYRDLFLSVFNAEWRRLKNLTQLVTVIEAAKWLNSLTFSGFLIRPHCDSRRRACSDDYWIGIEVNFSLVFQRGWPTSWSAHIPLPIRASLCVPFLRNTPNIRGYSGIEGLIYHVKYARGVSSRICVHPQYSR